jgi:hypothetical protein
LSSYLVSGLGMYTIVLRTDEQCISVLISLSQMSSEPPVCAARVSSVLPLTIISGTAFDDADEASVTLNYVNGNVFTFLFDTSNPEGLRVRNDSSGAVSNITMIVSFEGLCQID